MPRRWARKLPPAIGRFNSSFGTGVSRRRRACPERLRRGLLNALPRISLAKSRKSGRSFNNISSFSIIFLDTVDPAPYIGPVNARNAPAAAGPLPAHHSTHYSALRDGASRRSAAHCSSAPPQDEGSCWLRNFSFILRRRRRMPEPSRRTSPVSSGAPARPKGWKISYRDSFCARSKGVFPTISKGWGWRRAKGIVRKTGLSNSKTKRFQRLRQADIKRSFKIRPPSGFRPARRPFSPGNPPRDEGGLSRSAHRRGGRHGRP